jgi:hypothetical protein
MLFGECSGSGKKPYYCSVDFIDEEKPVPRCNCPSRQFPCKHAVGLLFAYLYGSDFTEEEIPEDVLLKREKLLQKSEKKQTVKKDAQAENPQDKKPPTKAKINAAIKKIDQQLGGIALAKNLLSAIVSKGLAVIDAKAKADLTLQIKELGNYYIGGIQTAFNELILFLDEGDKDFLLATEKLLYISALLEKAETHLENKKSTDPLSLSVDSAIEEQIGYVWKLDELGQAGNFESDAELLQLSFIIYEDLARKEFVDEGHFISLKSGQIYRKINYRPYKALKRLNQDDTFFEVMCMSEMYYYPGFFNPRFRADGFTERLSGAEDYARVVSFASDDFAAVQKAVKNEIKNPLAGKNPVCLLKPKKVSAEKVILPTDFVLNQDEKKSENVGVIIEDKNGVGQILSDCKYRVTPVMDKFSRIDPAVFENAAIAVMFKENISTGILAAKPLSIILPDRIIRLLF